MKKEGWDGAILQSRRKTRSWQLVHILMYLETAMINDENEKIPTWYTATGQRNLKKEEKREQKPTLLYRYRRDL